MADLKLSGSLNLGGTLKLSATRGGKVLVMEKAVLLEGAQGQGIPVIQPPPPGTPLNTGTNVKVVHSFNSSVMVKAKSGDYLPAVALGACFQGDDKKPVLWPGMVLPSTQNQSVTINRIPVNIEGDSAITLPNGGSATLDTSGQ